LTFIVLILGNILEACGDPLGSPTLLSVFAQANHPFSDPQKVCTGFIMRSSVISGWSCIQVEAFGGEKKMKTPVVL
jgi:hypothetical protein